MPDGRTLSRRSQKMKQDVIETPRKKPSKTKGRELSCVCSRGSIVGEA
jgi:hypothetical protein